MRRQNWFIRLLNYLFVCTCPNDRMSRLFTRNNVTYRYCTKCGAEEHYDPETFQRITTRYLRWKKKQMALERQEVANARHRAARESLV